MSELAQETCIPCRGGVPPLKGEELDALQEKLGNDWQIINEHHLEKDIYLLILDRHWILLSKSEKWLKIKVIILIFI
jgi:pterin-4-alpha-carbinolamine dehydratase (EC 4.2.1.96)